MNSLHLRTDIETGQSLPELERFSDFREGRPSLHYMPALDGIRAVAVTSVVLGHFGVPGFSLGGGFGVDAFFVLSGYLITRIILGKIAENKPLSEFYWNRFTRLFPPLLLVCASLFLLPPSLLTNWDAFLNSFGALTYVTNWTRAFPTYGAPSFTAHTWSLSVEEQFYLAWPVTVYLASRWLPNVRTAIFGITAISLIWFGLLIYINASVDHIYNGFDGRCPAILLGACLAALPNLKCPAPLAVVSFLAYLFMVLTQKWHPFAALILWTLTLPIIVYARDAASVGPLAKLLRLQPIIYLGVISYAVYLWHFPFYYLLGEKLHMGAIPTGILGISLTLILSVLTQIFVENPVRRLRYAIGSSSRQNIGCGIAIWTLLAFAGGLVFFYGGFV